MYEFFRASGHEGKLSEDQARLLTCLYDRLVDQANWQERIGAWVVSLPYRYSEFDILCSGVNCHSFASSFVYQPEFLLHELCK